jgi:hypothetical protein
VRTGGSQGRTVFQGLPEEEVLDGVCCHGNAGGQLECPAVHGGCTMARTWFPDPIISYEPVLVVVVVGPSRTHNFVLRRVLRLRCLPYPALPD